MSRKQNTGIGIEYDDSGIRAAQVVASRIGSETKFELDEKKNIPGPFENEKDLTAKLATLTDSFGFDRAQVATTLTGKQVFVSQLAFRKLPDSEMRSALRFELRKTLPFDIVGSTIEYQTMESKTREPGKVPILVSVVGGGLLNAHLKIFDTAGITPDVVDVLPLTLGNVLWYSHDVESTSGAHLLVYIGQGATTIVIDGAKAPFFTRTLYVNAHAIFGGQSGSDDAGERKQKADMLIDEIARTMSYYETTYKVAEFSMLHVVGPYAGLPAMSEFVSQGVGMPSREITLAESVSGTRDDGLIVFEPAIAAAIRATKG